MKTVKSILILPFFVILLPICCECAKLNDETVTIIKNLSRENQLEMTITLAEVPSDFPYTNGFRWGIELGRPEKILASIALHIIKQEVFIPLSAYGDLTNPISADLSLLNDIIILEITGGDASSSYVAKLRRGTDSCNITQL